MNLPTIDPIATIDEMIEDVNKRNKETVQDKVLCIVLKWILQELKSRLSLNK